MASPSGDDDFDDERLFDGVRFVLAGFDHAAESQYRSEMVQRGGVDAGRFGNDCTHVVVWGRVYDDPACEAARAEGKKVVSELWVDDSLDRGVLADADRVIYWPVRDLNGIPGGQSLHICLTGYQRNYREDIMKMVSLMGAQFSKPLTANAATHLICYKFEGEKYELAKKVNIKLVNHRWLEDCLKAWEVLPVDDYSKSSWELELMEAQGNDSEDEAKDAGQRPLNSRSSVRCMHNSNKCAETSVNPDVNAPMRSPIILSGNREVPVERHLNTPGHIRGTEDAGSKTHDITAQSSPNSSMLPVSAKADVFAPIQAPFVLSEKRENVAVRDINSPSPIQEAEEKYVSARTLDITSGALGAPSSSKMTIFGNRHLHSLNGTPTILNGNMDHVSGKCSVNHDQINVTKAQLTSPLRGNPSVNELDLSKVNDMHRQETDGPSGNHIAAAGQSNIDDKLTNHEVNPNSGGDFISNNIKNPSNSKKASRKLLSPEGHSVHHMASPHSAEESTQRADSNISSVGMGQQVVEHADILSMKGNENIKNADGLDGAYAQKRKSLISPASLNLQKRDVVSETGPVDRPFVSRLSDASEPANVSSAGTNPAEANAVNLGNQQSSLSTSRQSRFRTNSLKHGGPINGVHLPEYSSNGKNVKSLLKARTSLKAMTENRCTTSPLATVQDGKTSSGFSFRNKDGEDAQASGNAVNQDSLHLLHEIGNARTEDQSCDMSVHSSRNSQVVSCSGNADTKITDAPDVNNKEVAVASDFKLEKVSDTTVKKGTKRFQDTSSHFQGETSYSKKVAIPIERNAGAKRPRNASIEADGSVPNSGNKVVSESRPAKVIPREHADPASKNSCSIASAAELKPISPKKVLICRVRNTVAKRAQDAHSKFDDAQVPSSLEFGKVVSQENIEINRKKFFDTANADEHQINSPKKLPNTRVRNTAAKRSRKSDTNMSNETLIDKTETVAAGSLFDDLFASDNVEDCPKKLSSSASASDCGILYPKNVPNTRVRNAVAKRKIKTVEDNLGSKCDKIGSAIASVPKTASSKRIEEISCNVNKVTADQDSEKANKDGMRDVSGLSCQDSDMVDKPEGPHNSKLRSGKRNKVLTSDHERENRQDHSNLNSKSNARTGSLCSKFDARSMQKSTDVLSEHRRIKGDKSGMLITSEPALFILSGNRQQRREYRSILRRLKGRVCRDSHHWSYQATHFIAPDPLRRTEKFFAAAAAGRWILKRDYLTSCIEAGKFVDEEPFEWFGTDLSDGEKISLEAPKKWRILRQQMGHGAFYGMQIIVYGQLILPTLDTLKRAVRAGDGTILATSPPYTRFLDSGVDFAVVSASIPSADAWVQEFIRHGIPCVSTDYLVEYVCKPGHPLDRHVLFKTNGLANKFLKKLMKNQQEVATDKPEPTKDDEDPEDLSCSVCGRKDRGEVMLICGDEDGAAGCGIGMHIDCCNPPLEAVPEDDWLCPKCDVPKAKTKPTRGTGHKLRPSKQM
ncbi:BRCT domain-containing protein At4g02110-like [Phragmites australis]|uniref:BRCT domain-containing protein At4g02110-like n=1 Tax=Phragmites australis TaxID=29695 RepID=UPI002D77166E|nr:BRCT domain-containing protein At4g02110-like [Phragmites australis]